MIKILNREYGDACLIVGVADGTGSAEDPEGLSHSELLRLFEEGLPISEYRFNKVRAFFLSCCLVARLIFLRVGSGAALLALVGVGGGVAVLG